MVDGQHANEKKYKLRTQSYRINLARLLLGRLSAVILALTEYFMEQLMHLDGRAKLNYIPCGTPTATRKIWTWRNITSYMLFGYKKKGGMWMRTMEL